MAPTPPRTPPEGTPTPVEPRSQVEGVSDASPSSSSIAKGTREDIRDQATSARAEAALDVATAELVHDIRTPLSIIMIEAHLLEKRLGTRATLSVQRGIERIAQNAAYIDRLVSDLLDLSSMNAGQLELRIERVDLARLIGDTLDRAVSSVDRSRVNVEIRDILYVRADGARLERVIANLVGNALKFAAGSAVTLRLDSRGTYACISVIDSGPGLTSEQARTIFDRHQRAEEARAQEGYGLGLHICRRIMDAHGGRIGVTSTPGRGSRFFFELLAVPSPTAPRSG
jgi:signal transduction histidine kinase